MSNVSSLSSASVVAYNSADVLPVTSGFYLVDRGPKLGTPLRFFNADTGKWGRCEYTPEDAQMAKNSFSALPALPWRGPINLKTASASMTQPADVGDQIELARKGGVAFKPVAAEVASNGSVKPVTDAKVVEKVAKKVAKTKAAKSAPKSKDAFADGTIFFRADRNKWVAVWGGKQEAARPTKDACIKFLAKKYNFTAVTVIEPTAA